MVIRMASWNVNGRRASARQLAFVESLGCDLLALQEITAEGFDGWRSSGLFQHAASSLELRPVQEGEGCARRLGCALFARSGLGLGEPALIPGVPFPERTLLAPVEGTERPLTMCSVHIPPGSSWKHLKSESLTTIADWLAGQSGDVLLGLDANAPHVDHPDHRLNQWWRAGEVDLLGHAPRHRLVDAYRRYLGDHPGQMADIAKDHPEGPLAMSYDRGRGHGRSIPCRYDFILVPPRVEVVDLRYLYEEALQAGSDHGLVVAELQLAA